MKTQKDFDLSRYLGKWYEVGKNPQTPWEKDCNFAEAYYTLDKKNNIMLIRNTCLDENRKVKRESFGKARIPNLNDKSKLKVKFSGPDAFPFEGDYLVHFTNYDQYAIVGGGGLVWILARQPKIPKEDVPMLLHKVKSFGYNPDKVVSNKRLLY